MVWTPPASALGLQKILAFFWNQQVRDNLKALTEYTPYVPQLGSDGTPPATSTAQGGFIHAGNRCLFWARLVISAGGTGKYTVTYPVTAARVYNPGISGHFLDLSAVTPYALTAVNFSQTAFRMTHRTGPFLDATANSPVTIASGDEIVVGGEFEPA